jgi:hypothetical protein
MGGTNINDAILRALEIAKTVKDAEEIGSKTEQLIIFLSDGEPTSGAVTNQTQIKENIRNANKNTAIPIYGLAFGDGADYNLIKDISDENFAFAKRIYESGNSFEQLENFYKEISDPKLKKVTFEYLVNGKRIVQHPHIWKRHLATLSILWPVKFKISWKSMKTLMKLLKLKHLKL